MKSIGRYTDNTWGREQRNRYLALLDASFHELAANPLKGRDCGTIRTGYRKQGVGRHIVFYHQIAADCIEIVRELVNNPPGYCGHPWTRWAALRGPPKSSPLALLDSRILRTPSALPTTPRDALATAGDSQAPSPS